MNTEKDSKPTCTKDSKPQLSLLPKIKPSTDSKIATTFVCFFPLN